MSRKLLMLVLALALLLPAAAAPAQADSSPAKDYCKGADYTVTATADGGRKVSETVYLDWSVLYSANDTSAAFKNQGDCVSHAVRGGTLFAPLCSLLKDPDVRLSKCSVSRRGDVILDDLTC